MYHTTKTFKITKTKLSEVNGKMGIKIIYWGLENPSKKFFNSRIFRIDNLAGYFIEQDEAGEVC